MEMVMPSRPFCILWGIAFGLLALSIAHGQINSQRQAPKLLAQFYDKNNEWHKLTVDLLQRELTKDPSGWMYARIKDDRGLANRLQLLRRASVFQKLDEARLTYLIGDADGYDVESFFSKVGD